MLKLVLPIYYTFERKTKKDKTVLVGLNWYRNAHYFNSNEVKAHFHKEIETQARGTVFCVPVHVHYSVFQKRESVDGHNVRSILEKFALDGLKDSGVIVDDSTPKYIASTSTDFFIDKINPRIEITVTKKTGN